MAGAGTKPFVVVLAGTRGLVPMRGAERQRGKGSALSMTRALWCCGEFHW
jgi:hypothetical protein